MERQIDLWRREIDRLKNPDVSNNLLTAVRYRFPRTPVVHIDAAYNRYYKHGQDLTRVYDELAQRPDSKNCRHRDPEPFLTLPEMKALIRAETPYKTGEKHRVASIRFDPDHSSLVAELEDRNVERGPFVFHVPLIWPTAEIIGLLRQQGQMNRPPEPDDDGEYLIRVGEIPNRHAIQQPDIPQQHVRVKKEQCEICYENVPETQTLSCEKKHHFCHTCVKKTYTAMSLGEIKIISGCLLPNCGGCFDNEELGTVVSEKILGGIRFRKLQNKIKDQELYSCPYCSYTGPKNPDGTLQCYSKECARLSCIACQMDHEGKSCEEAQKNLKRKNKFTEQINENLVRRCPNTACRKQVLHDGGCNKMTCVCGTMFCWICNVDITEETYNHFCNCPGASSTRIVKCQSCSKCIGFGVSDETHVAIATEKAKEFVL